MEQRDSYSKVEQVWFDMFFRSFIDRMREKPDADPNVMFNSMDLSNRAFMRQAFGIQRVLTGVTDGKLKIEVGLEDRKLNYIIEVTL